MFQFPFGTMHQLNLDWFLQKFNELLEEWSTAEAGIDNALQAEIDRVEAAMTDLYAARDAAVNAADDAVPAAASAVQDALISEGFALGEQNGTPVGAGSPYYQANAKFYSTTAGTYRYLSEAYARGTMGGTPVDPGDAGYEDNAKYYKDAADIDASTASGAAISATADALIAEGNAVGEQNGTPVASGSPYYQNNAKYYSLQTAQDKSDTDTLKDAANAAALRAEGWANGEQNGTPVASGSPYYQNNAKYYKEEAETVAASIPLDYTALSTDVAALNNWVQVPSSGITLDPRFNINNFTMYYNKAIHILFFVLRINPSENITTQVTSLMTFPVPLPESQLIQSETGRNCFTYGDAILMQAGTTLTTGTNYRFSGILYIT